VRKIIATLHIEADSPGDDYVHGGTVATVMQHVTAKVDQVAVTDGRDGDQTYTVHVAHWREA
jgi:hypothetical protein